MIEARWKSSQAAYWLFENHSHGHDTLRLNIFLMAVENRLKEQSLDHVLWEPLDNLGSRSKAKLLELWETYADQQRRRGDY